MPKIAIKRSVTDRYVLLPASREAEDYVTNWEPGEVRLCNVTRMRNPDHHKKAFAILNFALANQEQFPTTRMLLEAVKVIVGHVEEIRIASTGKVHYVTKSISFGAMGQDEFNTFYEQMLAALEGLTGIPVETLEQGGRE